MIEHFTAIHPIIVKIFCANVLSSCFLFVCLFVCFFTELVVTGRQKSFHKSWRVAAELLKLMANVAEVLHWVLLDDHLCRLPPGTLMAHLLVIVMLYWHWCCAGIMAIIADHWWGCWWWWWLWLFLYIFIRSHIWFLWLLYIHSTGKWRLSLIL